MSIECRTPNSGTEKGVSEFRILLMNLVKLVLKLHEANERSSFLSLPTYQIKRKVGMRLKEDDLAQPFLLSLQTYIKHCFG